MEQSQQQAHQDSSLPSLNNGNNMSISSKMRNHKMNRSFQENSVYETDKKKYGALLPKTGVYFLPDERIIVFLK